MKRLTISVMLLCCGLFQTEYAGAQLIDSVDSHTRQALINHYKKYPQEKIFLHTDADIYASGQTIWYKAYSMIYGKPSDLSNIIYVVLADSIGNPILKNKLPLKDGRAHGNIDIPDTLHTGWYQLTGFTAWMMNFGEENVFHKRIYIQNLVGAVVGNAATDVKTGYHIKFFPEGGDPVEGDLCNIAFKATDDNGRPVEVEGEVLNNDKKIIAKINSMHDGMGVFSIEGYAGKKNIAVVRFPDKTVQTVILPGFKKNGIMMKVNPLPADGIGVKISFNGDISQYRNLVLAAYQENGTFNTYQLQLSEGINLFTVKKTDFSTGILRLTLFNEQSVPLAERIVFINKNEQLKLSLSADSISVQPRALSNFKLQSLYANGKKAAGNFSVSVTDADAIGGDEAADNIYSSMLMSSELTGNVFHPAYYFKNNSDTLQQQLDLVMMTNGWRHFKWSKDTVVLKYLFEKSQFIAGRIAGYNEMLNAKSHLKLKLMIQNQDSSKYFTSVEPDSIGRFIVRDYNRSGTATILIETRDSKNHVKKQKVSLYNTLADSLLSICYLPLDSTFDNTGNINEQFLLSALGERQAQLKLKGITLKMINVRERPLTPTEEIIKDHVKHLDASTAQSFDLVSFPMPTINILDYLNGRVPGLQILKDPINGLTFIYHGPSVIIGANDVKPTFYIDEMPASLEEALEFPMQEIALIRFIPPPVWFAPLNGGAIGAVMIYTRNSNDEKRGIQRYNRFGRYTFDGYTITREFASPDYSKPKTNTPADNRTTLYWNHDLDTHGGHANFSFYNSDKTKRCRIIIEGMDADGRMGYLNEVFQTTKPGY